MTVVKQNRNTLRLLRTSFENAEKMATQTQKLENVGLFLQRLQIIGVIIEFQVSFNNMGTNFRVILIFAKMCENFAFFVLILKNVKN